LVSSGDRSAPRSTISCTVAAQSSGARCWLKTLAVVWHTLQRSLMIASPGPTGGSAVAGAAAAGGATGAVCASSPRVATTANAIAITAPASFRALDILILQLQTTSEARRR
jgi:hypothetical protein